MGLTRLDLQEHFAALQAEGLAQVTVHTHYRAIRRFLAWLVETGALTANPLAGFAMKRPQTFPAVPRDDDIQRLLGGCEDGREGVARKR